jgi:ATP-dependent Clp protease ATP-binding subunit ClpA
MNSFFGSDRLSLLVTWEIGANIASQFEVEAKRDGAEFIEAEHMLLALAADRDGDAAKLLKQAGLDHARLASALQEERRRTLAFAGMSAPSKELVEATALESSLTFGTSAKTALRRGLMGSRGDHRRRPRIRATDLLMGILQAELGTVPRALAIAGIDRAALLASTRGSEVPTENGAQAAIKMGPTDC